MPSLVVSLNDEEVTHELTEDTYTLGRVEENAIQIDDASVSSRHAELLLQGEDYVLKDIGSTNGTRVNGRPIEVDQEVPLKANDRIIFGNIAVQYLSETAAALDDLPPMPDEDEPAITPASTSVAPTNFTNASPFPTRKEKKDSAGTAVLALGVLALLAAGYAIFAVVTMQPPA